MCACICRIRRPRSYVEIEGRRYEVEPSAADTPTSALLRAWCAGRGAEYTCPYRLVTIQNQPA
jgi:hypothetical protein